MPSRLAPSPLHAIPYTSIFCHCHRGSSILIHLRTLACLLPLAVIAAPAQAPQIFGYRDFTQQAKWDASFMAVPDPTLAGQHLKTLTAEPHWASSPEDYKTALYVASKFKQAGLQTEIVPFKVLMNKPIKILVEAFDSNGKKILSGPTPEHVDPVEYGGDPFQNDPRILPPFNGSSPSGDVTAQVVYANYGTLADFKELARLGISVKGKIVLVRYGANFRGVKVYIAQQYGAKGVLIYSDPADDGYNRGDAYPQGPYRPPTGVQRGSVQFLPIYPGDSQTPGIASTPDLRDSARIPADQLQHNQPTIPANPLSFQDAEPILQALQGTESPNNWQGGLPFTYHIGDGPGADTGKVIVHMHLEQDIALRTIWDVIGKIPGTSHADDWVIAGNHRDAWVYGAVDPNSGTAAMLETVHGLGEILKQGWKPRRTVIIASWDAEEEGLIGSTEWAEQHAAQLSHAVAYFNTDIGVSGPFFNAAAVPSLKEFVREVTKEVPSPIGGTVYDQWKHDQSSDLGRPGGMDGDVDESSSPLSSGIREPQAGAASPDGTPQLKTDIPAGEAHIGTLGSGSDYTPFIQHLGIPSTDVGSNGPYGVYHSAFDNYNWFIKFADPTFVYEQQQARVFGLEVLHMADADVLPYDYQSYGREIVGYITSARKRAAILSLALDFTPALAAAQRFAAAGTAIHALQAAPPSGLAQIASLNQALRSAEDALLNPDGLPHRPWYKHIIYAPGEFTGYAAVVIPGVNEAIDAADLPRAQSQLGILAAALNRSAAILEAVAK
jgi:N-acetylated-alpha-linked acidic dipeptidase